jgi:hypothetical protein
MEPLGWQRIRIDPATPQWWREGGSFVIGHVDDRASGAVEVSNWAQQFSTLVALLDGSHSAHSLLQSGQAMGVPVADVRAFLVSLAESGHIHEVKVTATPLLAHSAVRNVRHLARVRGLSEDFILTRREHFRVLVDGIGAVAAQTYSSCVQAGLTAGWLAESERKVRIDDCVGLSLNPDTVGTRWSELSEPVRSPHLVISIRQSHAATDLTLRYPAAIVLPLTVHQRRMSSGPILNAAGGLCANCIDTLRGMADPDWAYRHAQLTGADLAPPIIADAFRDAFVGSVMAWVLEIADTQSTHGLHESSWELLPPTPVWQQRPWTRLGECTCNDFQEVDLAI